jgi:hypothetical protein
MSIRKDLEDQMVALVEELSCKIETEEDVLNLRRQMKELQCAVTDEEDKIYQLLIHIERLCLGNDEKQVSHCISRHKDSHIGQSLAPGCRWKVNIKMDFKEIDCDNVDLIELAQVRFQLCYCCYGCSCYLILLGWLNYYLTFSMLCTRYLT